MSRAGKFARYLLLAIILIVMVFPLVWMFVFSLKIPGGGFSLDNFTYIFSANRFGRYLFNSLFVGAVVTAANILFCFMCGYALAMPSNTGFC